jgi:anaerobic magnesium-protoporphyrin IX monomethyl ester cyclase
LVYNERMLLGKAPSAHEENAHRLLLIKARIEDREGEGSAPPIGVMQLGATARAWSGWQVRAVDLFLEKNEEAAIRDALKQYPAEVIGLSGLTAEADSLYRAARYARLGAPEAIILAGGPHASSYTRETLARPEIDGVVIGEGELTLQEILDSIAAGSAWDDVAGTAVKNGNGGCRINSSRPFIENLDELPLPAWDLTNIDAYGRRRGMALVGRRRYLPISLSRGCPYRCTYCHQMHGKKFRANSAGYALQLVDRAVKQYGVHHFDVVDDIFNFDPDRLRAICEGFTARGNIRYTLPNGIRSDRLDAEQVRLMSKAGLEYVAIAVETASPRLQKMIHKNLQLDKVRVVIEQFARERVIMSGFFMVGFPTETEDDMQMTIDFALKSSLHNVLFFVVSPYEGTELYEQVLQKARQKAGESHFDLKRVYLRQRVNLSEIPDRRFNWLRSKGYIRFFGNPRRLWRILRDHPRKRAIISGAFVVFFRDILHLNPSLAVGTLPFVKRTLARRMTSMRKQVVR